MKSKETAYRLAKHYFRLLAEKAGIRWGRDNDAEIEALIDAIIEATWEEADELPI